MTLIYLSSIVILVIIKKIIFNLSFPENAFLIITLTIIISMMYSLYSILKVRIKNIQWNKIDDNIEKQKCRINTLISIYLDNNNIRRSTLEITNIEYEISNKEIIIKITLERPGLLIGTHGKTITGLEEYLTKNNDKLTKIKIEESKLWWSYEAKNYKEN